MKMRTLWPRRRRGCPGSRTIRHSRVRTSLNCEGSCRIVRRWLYQPATRPTRPRQAVDGIGVVADQGGLALLDAAGELLLDRGADHLRAVGGEQHGRLPAGPEHVARADEDAEDGAGPRGLQAAFLQGQPRLLAPGLGRLQLGLGAADLDLDVLGLQLGQALGLGALQGLELADLLLADGSVRVGDDGRLRQPLLALQDAARRPRPGCARPRASPAAGRSGCGAARAASCACRSCSRASSTAASASASRLRATASSRRSSSAPWATCWFSATSTSATRPGWSG